MKPAGVFFLWLAWGTPAFCEDSDSAALNPIRVQGNQSGFLKQHEITKTEVVTKESIEHNRAQTVADAVAGQVGINTQNSCANCGAKRVMINGLRGEHTTVLIDGVPLHSAISSFYGLDAIPVVGIESIEVSRGSGAALIAPEAIGGVLNIVTFRPTQTGMTVNGNIGNAFTNQLGALGSVVFGEGRFGLALAGQLSHQGHWDVDGNLVSDAADLENQSFFIKSTSQLGSRDRIDARYARLTVDILGGETDGTRPTTYSSSQLPTDFPFTDNDVSKKYLGTQGQITDVVDLARHEGVLRWSHFFPQGVQTQLTGSLAEQEQKSIYMHGYDYNNKDLLFYADGRVVFGLGDSHFFTLGLELKNQDMASQSQALYTVMKLPNDDFSYRSRAGFLQHVWLASEGFELSTALRVDHMQVNWLAQTNAQYEIDQTLLAPRVHLKWQHGTYWTSRLMYGRGYRPPLSFFESQHGLNENGFQVAITNTEQAHSLGYSLAFTHPSLAISGASHYTWLDHMAYADGNVAPGSPALFQNSNQEYQIWANDVLVSWNAASNWNLQLSYEHYSMPGGYKVRLPAAALEQRVRLISDYHLGDWEFMGTLSWIGPRDLTQYGYDQHYRVWQEELSDPTDPFSALVPTVTTGKNTTATGFFTLDLYIGWQWRPKYSFFASVTNAFNFTQTGAGDSPLNWSTHGGNATHFHLDNNHTWGPLRGRIFAVGLKAQI